MGLFEKKERDTTRGHILTADCPFAYAEAYKMLRTNLSFASVSKKYKKIIITSARPDEGKSTVAINLGITLAETGARVLLMDCDLRNPTLHRLLRIRRGVTKGLTALLTGKASIDECVFSHPQINCDFILAGTVPPNPAELLGSSRMEAVLKELNARYDYIIFDTPPVSVVTDAAALSRYSDGVILVVRQKASTRDQVWMARRNLEAVQANIIGTILSCYDITKDTREMASPYYDSYSNYGSSDQSRKSGEDKV